MQNHMNFTRPNGDDFRFHGERKLSAQSLDLFAEELPEQHDLRTSSTLSTTSTVSTAGGGCLATIFTFGCLA